jgi:hypothetical protein
VFYIDVAKVDWDVAHIAICSQVYVLNVSSISDVYCKCFIWMLQKYIWMLHIHACCKRVFHVFYTSVASVLSGYCICFAVATKRVFLVFHMHVVSVLIISDVCYKCFHLDIVKVDLGIAYVAVEPICSARSACIRVGVEGAPRCGRGTRSNTGLHVKQAQAFRRWPRPDIRALEVP